MGMHERDRRGVVDSATVSPFVLPPNLWGATPAWPADTPLSTAPGHLYDPQTHQLVVPGGHPYPSDMIAGLVPEDALATHIPGDPWPAPHNPQNPDPAESAADPPRAAPKRKPRARKEG